MRGVQSVERGVSHLLMTWGNGYFAIIQLAADKDPRIRMHICNLRGVRAEEMLTGVLGL